ncbi:MAG: glycosyltransferase family 4 protein [Burkholderiales bacterium]|nr:glycosyltransferase family 4 protein [Burkholderiales bacterium]
MRVLVAHNTYLHRGGEDIVVEAETELLQRFGHEVRHYRRNNEELGGRHKARVAIDTLWSSTTVQELQSIIADFSPDVLHVHNAFPLISPSIYWEASRAHVPVVQTLHNFRLLCPQAMFLRADRVCEDCLSRIPWRGILHCCYRGSATQSAVLAASLSFHRLVGTWQKKVARYIALSEFARRKFIEGGLPADRITVKPNFAAIDPLSADAASDGLRAADSPGSALGPSDGSPGGLYVGRLSTEKGIQLLLSALSKAGVGPMRFVGDGPEYDCVKRSAYAMPLGHMPPEGVIRIMRTASFLVVPSICYENFPRTLAEAYACGLPVIASRLGSMVELVQDGITGLLFEPGSSEDLAAKIRWATANPREISEMGRRAKLEYEEKFKPERNYALLMSIYEAAMALAKKAPCEHK